MPWSAESIVVGSAAAAIYHPVEEEVRPSRATVTEFTLPLRVHFRYCWLFSGIPKRHAQWQALRGTKELTGEDAIRANRALFSGYSSLGEGLLREYPDVSGQEEEEGECDPIGMKAFWLTGGGALVCVERPSDDAKLSSLRLRNLHDNVSMWAVQRDLCSHTMKASAAAHSHLIELCADAARRDGRQFHNLYAAYPLPVEGQERALTQDGTFLRAENEEASRRLERSVRFREIRSGEELLRDLRPMYAAHRAILNASGAGGALHERVALLGAQWLVREERAELRLSEELRSSALSRWVTQCAMFLSQL